jgi:hypothetical protein
MIELEEGAAATATTVGGDVGAADSVSGDHGSASGVADVTATPVSRVVTRRGLTLLDNARAGRERSRIVAPVAPGF